MNTNLQISDANAKVMWLRQNPPYYTPPDVESECRVDDEFSEMFRDNNSGRRLVLTIGASFCAFVGVVALAAAAWLA